MKLYMNVYEGALRAALYKEECQIILDPLYNNQPSRSHRTITTHQSLEGAIECVRYRECDEYYIKTLEIGLNDNSMREVYHRSMLPLTKMFGDVSENT